MRFCRLFMGTLRGAGTLRSEKKTYSKLSSCPSFFFFSFSILARSIESHSCCKILPLNTSGPSFKLASIFLFYYLPVFGWCLSGIRQRNERVTGINAGRYYDGGLCIARGSCTHLYNHVPAEISIFG